MKATMHIFLNLSLDREEKSVLYFGKFTPGERYLVHTGQDKVRTRNGLNVVVQRKIPNHSL
jgi:hypothetical protein